MSGPKLAASRADDTRVGTLTAGATSGDCTAQPGAVPTSPITADFTTETGTGPLATSITSIPCRKLAGIYFTCFNFAGGILRGRSRLPGLGDHRFRVAPRDLDSCAGWDRTGGHADDDAVHAVECIVSSQCEHTSAWCTHG